MKKVLIVMGSDSDLPVMQNACKVLDELGVGYEVRISSAHRAPAITVSLLATTTPATSASEGIQIC